MRHTGLVLAILTMVAACTDAISYLGLGSVFPANMTGNTVLLGIGLATGRLDAAARSATALGAFLLGAAGAGAAVPGRARRGSLLAVLTVEVLAMTAFCGGWLTAPGSAPSGGRRFALIALAGLTMGLQSGVVRALGVPVATTYITGTWTSLSAGLAARLRRSTGGSGAGTGGGPSPVQAVVVLTYLGTAAGAALASTRLGAVAAALPDLLLVGAAAVAAAPPADA